METNFDFFRRDNNHKNDIQEKQLISGITFKNSSYTTRLDTKGPITVGTLCVKFKFNEDDIWYNDLFLSKGFNTSYQEIEDLYQGEDKSFNQGLLYASINVDPQHMVALLYKDGQPQNVLVTKGEFDPYTILGSTAGQSHIVQDFSYNQADDRGKPGQDAVLLHQIVKDFHAERFTACLCKKTANGSDFSGHSAKNLIHSL